MHFVDLYDKFGGIDAMNTKHGFNKLSVAEFKTWISATSVTRMITRVQEHHTWIPNYESFSGSNHFEMQRSMKDHHVGKNGWSDIGQHFSIFPDGMIVTGRPMNAAPACIYGNNADSICIENVGNFDVGKDAMSAAQRDAIIQVTGALAKRFNLTPVTTNNIVYHHWFDLNTGARTNGAGITKSCPGTAFFGGNTVSDCQANFLPLVRAAMGNTITIEPDRYGRVRAFDPLNVRIEASATASLAADQSPLEAGSIVRIFGETNGWLKVSNSKEHWVYSRYVEPVERRTVTADDSKVRWGSGTSFEIRDTLMKGSEVFVGELSGDWGQIGVGEEWISLSLLS